MVVRHDGRVVSRATMLRVLRYKRLILPAHYQRERRQLAQRCRLKAAFATDPTGANQVWQLDCPEFEITTGGTWRLAGSTGASTSPPRLERPSIRRSRN